MLDTHLLSDTQRSLSFTGAPNTTQVVGVVSNCKLPPFWRANPELWFIQAESAFHTHGVRSDSAKYHLAVPMLDSDSLQEIEDIIRLPPQEGKYAQLKTTILTRLGDTVDTQLLKLFTKLELGDRKPSQLLRHMRSLADERVSEDVLKVKWMDLLPVNCQRLLRIFKASNLEELAVAADELVETAPTVSIIRSSSQVAVTTVANEPAAHKRNSIHAKLADLRSGMVQLISINREILARLSDSPLQQRNRSTSRGSRPRSRL